MIRYIVPTVLIALLILFFVTRENSSILVYEGEDNFSTVKPDALLVRHFANFDKLKQVLANKGSHGVRLRLVPTGGAGRGGEGRCRYGQRGNACINRNNNCADAITWCPTGTVATQHNGGNNPPCQCAALHTNFSGYNFKPV
jgi:hypothetical protein